MKLNLNENMVRALARNILFESNEKIPLHELNMSPDKTGNGNSRVMTTANDKKKGQFDRPGPMKNDSSPEDFDVDTDELPIGKEQYGGQVKYDIPTFSASLNGDVDKYLEDDDFDASKSTLPSLMAQFGKKIDDANVDDYFEKVKNLTKQYLKKQK
jgi:hypothetical protein